LLPINYNISITGDCSGEGTGSILFSISGGTPPYLVNLTSPFVGSYATYGELLLTGLTEGLYEGSISDSSSPTLYIGINTPISGGFCVSFEGVTGGTSGTGSSVTTQYLIQNTTCGLDNGSVTLNTTSQYSSINYYLYNTDDVLISSAITNAFNYEFLNLSAGTYYVVAEDLGGCTASTPTFIIESSNELTFGLYVVPNAACGDIPVGKIFITGLTGSPPFAYQWTNGSIENTITGLTAGDYGVTVTDGFGCQHTVNTTLEDVPPVGLGIITTVNPTCFTNDGSISVTITGGTVPYYFSASTGAQQITYDQTFTISGLSPGEYSFLVTDATFCTFTTDTILTPPGGIQSVSINAVNSTCSSSDGSISVAVVGGIAPYTYTLIYPNSDLLDNTNNQLTYSFNGLESGTYTVSVEDSTGCGYMEEVIIIAEDKFTIQTFTTGTTCNLSNGVVKVEATEGYELPLTYSIDSEQTTVTSLTAVTFTNLSAGTHTVEVTDAFGCVQTKQVSIATSVQLLFSLYPVNCNGGDNGSVTALITSGTPPYTFNWTENISGNPQDIQVTGLSNGTYGVSIVDSNGCSSYQQTSINCDTTFTSGTSGILFQTYIMGEGVFELQSPTKCGLLEMLNEGYQDLIEDNEDCNLNSATFTAKVSVNPLGVEESQEFFTTDSLIVAPTDNLWYDTINDLLLNIEGIGNVIVDPVKNSIIIETIPNDLTLNNQQITIELIINYDVSCSG
jgi:uncharacterized protein (DUF2141 family)